MLNVAMVTRVVSIFNLKTMKEGAISLKTMAVCLLSVSPKLPNGFKCCFLFF